MRRATPVQKRTIMIEALTGGNPKISPRTRKAPTEEPRALRAVSFFGLRYTKANSNTDARKITPKPSIVTTPLHRSMTDTRLW